MHTDVDINTNMDTFDTDFMSIYIQVLIVIQ